MDRGDKKMVRRMLWMMYKLGIFTEDEWYEIRRRTYGY